MNIRDHISHATRAHVHPLPSSPHAECGSGCCWIGTNRCGWCCSC